MYRTLILVSNFIGESALYDVGAKPHSKERVRQAQIIVSNSDPSEFNLLCLRRIVKHSLARFNEIFALIVKSEIQVRIN